MTALGASLAGLLALAAPESGSPPPAAIALADAFEAGDLEGARAALAENATIADSSSGRRETSTLTALADRTWRVFLGLATLLAMVPLQPAAAQTPTELAVQFLVTVERGDLRAAQSLLSPETTFARDSQPQSLDGLAAFLRGCTRTPDELVRGMFADNGSVLQIQVDYECGSEENRRVDFEVRGETIVSVDYGENRPPPVYVPPEGIAAMFLDRLEGGDLAAARALLPDAFPPDDASSAEASDTLASAIRGCVRDGNSWIIVSDQKDAAHRRILVDYQCPGQPLQQMSFEVRGYAISGVRLAAPIPIVRMRDPASPGS